MNESTLQKGSTWVRGATSPRDGARGESLQRLGGERHAEVELRGAVRAPTLALHPSPPTPKFKPDRMRRDVLDSHARIQRDVRGRNDQPHELVAVARRGARAGALRCALPLVEEGELPGGTFLRVGWPALRSGRHGSDDGLQCPTEQDAGHGRAARQRTCSGGLAGLLGPVATLEFTSCGGRRHRSATRRIGCPELGQTRKIMLPAGRRKTPDRSRDPTQSRQARAGLNRPGDSGSGNFRVAQDGRSRGDE